MNALKKCIKSCSRQRTYQEVNACEIHCNKKYLQASEDEIKHNMDLIAFNIAKSAMRDPHKKYMEDLKKYMEDVSKLGKSRSKRARKSRSKKRARKSRSKKHARKSRASKK
jgi:hypothetical protein